MSIDDLLPSVPPTELQKLQMDMGWKWFQYHADQRIKAFNYMILSLGVLTSALATAAEKISHPAFAALSLVALIVAFLFYLLDRRNRDLVWLGEDVLKHMERTLVFREMMGEAKGPIFRGILTREEEKLQIGGLIGFFIDFFWSGKHRYVIPAFAFLFAAMFAASAYVSLFHGEYLFVAAKQAHMNLP